MASGNSVMQLDTGTGWTRGLDNLLRAEMGRWFGTRRWWVQILIWAAIANAIPIMAAVGTTDTTSVDLVMIFSILMGIGAPIGVCIIMQEAIVGEKQTGTAAWVLSKPVSRLAFLTSKLVGNGVGIATTMVIAQGAILYVASLLLFHTTLPVPGFVAGMGVHMVNLLFYVGLTLMLGALFDHRAPVIGLPLAFLFVQQYLPALYRGLTNAIPWSLTTPPNNGAQPAVTTALMTGVRPDSYLPVFTTLAAAIVFLAVAAWAFQRQEL
jgi:ABC-2 type transport system permease protein